MIRVRFSVLCLVVLTFAFVPASADAQRVCFSFASEDNVDGPNFEALGPNMLNDGAALNPDGAVQVRLLIQPGCDNGPIHVRNLELQLQTHHIMYVQNGFAGNVVHNWAREGNVTFFDPATGANFLQINTWKLLMTSWSPFAANMGETATLQVSEDTDPMIQFISSPDLDSILISYGLSPSLLNVGEQFAFTLTNIRQPWGGAPFNPPVDAAVGDWLSDWEADGSFSAAAGR